MSDTNESYDELYLSISKSCEAAYMGKMRIRKIRAVLHEVDLMLEHLAALELAETHFASMKTKTEDTAHE